MFQQAISFSIQVFRSLLKKYTESANENITLELLLEIFKAHKKCQKYMTHKEAYFSSLLMDTYKAYIKNKIKLPENASVLDMAIKLCQYEINSRKMSEKQSTTSGSGGGISMLSILPDPMPRASSPQIKMTVAPTQNTLTQIIAVKSKSPPNIENISSPVPTPPISIVSSPPPPVVSTVAPNTSSSSPTSTTSRTSGISKSRRSGGSKNTEIKDPLMAQLQMANLLSDSQMMSSLIAMYSNPSLMSMLSQYSDKSMQNQMMNEYYKQLGMSASGLSGLSNLASLMPGLPMNLHPSLHSPTTSSIMGNSSKIQDSINVGGELTITAVHDKPSQKTISTSKSGKDKSGQLPSVLKKDLLSSSFSSKLFQDTSSSLASWNSTSSVLPQTKSMLPDLPKSLSITPTNMPPTQYKDTLKQQKTSQPKVRDSQKYADKLKPNKKHHLINPYSIVEAKQNSKQSTKLPTQSPLPGFTLQEYNQQLALLSKYTSQLNSAGYGLSTLPTKKSSAKKQQHLSQSSKQQLMQQTSIIPIPSISPQSQTSRTPPIVGPPSTSTYNKNMSPILMKSSPTKSPILPMNYGRQSMTPPSTTPPTKTLQQKLAEAKQKANACMSSEANNAKKSG